MTAEQIACYIVAEAVWAPSVHNTQPWRFVTRRTGPASIQSNMTASRSACTPIPAAGWPWPIQTAAS